MFKNQQKVISNQYPAWKYLLLVVVTVLGLTYAMPNIFGDDPAVQISPAKSVEFDLNTQQTVAKLLEDNQLDVKSSVFENGKFLIRFNDTEDQLKAKSILKEALGRTAVVALNLAPATPSWLSGVGGQPMYLGLDLRGGVHFLMDVDMEAAVEKSYQRSIDEVKGALREAKLRYLKVEVEQGELIAQFRKQEDAQQSLLLLTEVFNERFIVAAPEQTATPTVTLRLKEAAIIETQKYALQQILRRFVIV